MIAFKIDENLPIEVRELLRQGGFDALTVVDQKLGGRPDTDVAAVCCSEGDDLHEHVSEVQLIAPMDVALFDALRCMVQQGAEPWGMSLLLDASRAWRWKGKDRNRPGEGVCFECNVYRIEER